MKIASIKYLSTCLIATTLLCSFNIISDKGKSFCSSAKIVNGVTDETKIKTSFSAGEEIYIYLPTKKESILDDLSKSTSFGLDVDGKSLFRYQFMPYNPEAKLNYLVFGLAIKPTNHMPDNHPRKEALADDVLKDLATIPVGNHKVKFGFIKANGTLDQSIEFTITVTEDGQKTWASWAVELEKMNKIYSYKTK